MKPFTLEWWLEVYKKCAGYTLGFYDSGQRKKVQYWNKKLEWVENRIIKKYGE